MQCVTNQEKIYCLKLSFFFNFRGDAWTSLASSLLLSNTPITILHPNLPSPRPLVADPHLHPALVPTSHLHFSPFPQHFLHRCCLHTVSTLRPPALPLCTYLTQQCNHSDAIPCKWGHLCQLHNSYLQGLWAVWPCSFSTRYRTESWWSRSWRPACMSLLNRLW